MNTVATSTYSSFDAAVLRASLIRELKRIKSEAIADKTTGMSRNNAWQLLRTENLRSLPAGTNAAYRLRVEFDIVITSIRDLNTFFNL